MGLSLNIPKSIIRFEYSNDSNGIFHYKPSILGMEPPDFLHAGQDPGCLFGALRFLVATLCLSPWLFSSSSLESMWLGLKNNLDLRRRAVGVERFQWSKQRTDQDPWKCCEAKYMRFGSMKVGGCYGAGSSI